MSKHLISAGRHGTACCARVEGLESRWLLSADAKYSQPIFYFNDIQAGLPGGEGMSASQLLIIRNAGDEPLRFNSKGMTILGEHADEFVFTGKKAPATIQPGATRSVPIAFNAKGPGIRTATLRMVSNDRRPRSVSIELRGLSTRGAEGNLEPSLQDVFALYKLPINTGDSNPNNTAFDVPPQTPNDEVDMQQMVKAGPGPVSFEMLGLFVNDRGPALSVGWYQPGQPEAFRRVFQVLRNTDSQTVRPTKIGGNSTFDPGDAAFGLFVEYPAFTYRHAHSEDALNTWETKAANRRKIRFYPLKNPDGTVEPNAYIFAAEDYNVEYDFQDGVGIIRNVKPASAAPSIYIENTDVLPNNNRLVFNRISNPDPIRANVTKEKAKLLIANSGKSTLVIESLSLSDKSNFKIVSGGGSNIQLAPGQSRTVTIQFVANPSSGMVATYNANLTITSNDPETPQRVVELGALWQRYSEQSPDKKYSEPTVAQVVNNVFGYKSVILNPGERMNHMGKPVKVGEEVQSAYWELADPNIGVKVRMIGAFHRQNNFDPETGEPTSAASSVRWHYHTGKSTPPNTTSNIFAHHIDEGQTLLPHLTKSSTKFAEGTFKPEFGKAFGFKVDNRFSDRTYNPPDFDKNGNPVSNSGHAFRFYPLRDSSGRVVANTYIMANDYTANQFANWDYNDNIYIVSNIKPAALSSASALSAPAPRAAASTPTLFSTDAVKEQSRSDVLL